MFKNRKDSFKLCIFRCFILLSLFAVLVSAFFLIRFYKPYADATNEYKALENQYVVKDDGESKANKKAEQNYSVKLLELHKVNSDCVGWIRFPHLKISYPITQGNDNSYYLSHGFSKEYLRSGCIFMDCSNNSDFSDYNTWIYGHNMRNNTMFAPLNSLASEKVFRKNPYFYIYTPKYVLRCDIFSVYTVDSSVGAYPTSFPCKNDFSNYLKEISSKSFFKTKVTVKDSDRIVSLATCTSVEKNERLIVQAVISSEAIDMIGTKSRLNVFQCNYPYLNYCQKKQD